MTGQIIARGPNTWLVRVFMGRDASTGKRRYVGKTIHGTKKDAQRYLTGVLRDRDLGTYVEPTSMTVNAFLDRWLETVAQHRVRPTTFRDYKGKLDLYVRPAIGHLKLGRVTALEVQGIYQAMLARNLSPRTVRCAHVVLSSAFDQAIKWRHMNHNPAAGAELPRQQRKEMLALDAEQSARFLAAAAQDRYGIVFAFAIATGMRPSEYLALLWTDLDLKAGKAIVRRGLFHGRDGWYFAETKTSHSRRTVHLPPSLVKALQEHRRRQLEERLSAGASYVTNNFVFATTIGTPLSPNNLSKRHFKPILRTAKLPDVRLYDLRHTCATLLLLSEVNPKVVSERLGHGSIQLTLDVYSHVLPAMQSAATSHLETLLFGSV